MPDEPYDFERPLLELEKRVEELEQFSRRTGVDLSEQIRRLREKGEEERKTVFSNLTAWQRIQLARHPARPDTADYIPLVFDELLELHGDRAFGDDQALVTGLARIEGKKILFVGQCKGRNTQERIRRNFGMPHPDGFRKAWQKMKLAEKFVIPIVTFVNTPGAYPGIGAEERGQAWAIAENLYLMSGLRVPILSVIIGEGGSGGALGICLADRLLILQNAYLSVISPEGCAAILWRDNRKAPMAAELLKVMPQDLKSLGVVDEILPEPLGGAHRNHKETAETIRAAIVRNLKELESKSLDELLAARYARYRKIGSFAEERPGS